jgi:hypothetical protein
MSKIAYRCLGHSIKEWVTITRAAFGVVFRQSGDCGANWCPGMTEAGARMRHVCQRKVQRNKVNKPENDGLRLQRAHGGLNHPLANKSPA